MADTQKTDCYFVAFLVVVLFFSESHNTSTKFLWMLYERFGCIFDHPEKKLSTGATSGASGRASEKLESICNSQVNREDLSIVNLVVTARQLFAATGISGQGFPPISVPLSPEAPPTFEPRRALWAGKRWKPIDISGIDCSALRLCRQNPVDFPVDRRAVVSASLLDLPLCRRLLPGLRRNHGALDSKPRLGRDRGPLTGRWRAASPAILRAVGGHGAWKP